VDIELRKKLIKKYSLRFFQDLDKGVFNKKIVEYYQKKYNSPMHLVVSVQHKSQELRPIEIDEEIHNIKGVKIGAYYYSCWIQKKLKAIFGPEFFPAPNRSMREHKKVNVSKNGLKTNRHPVTAYEGKCFVCNKKYKVNIQNHPANLCACLKCAPNGVGFESYSVRHGLSSAA